ncbi:MAG: ABC transporter permease subunit [bacterium]
MSATIRIVAAPRSSSSRWSWRDPRARAAIWQVVIVGLLVGTIALIAVQTTTNLRSRGIASGFTYLTRSAGFEIPESTLSYSSRDSYGRALAVGIVNTLRVSTIGVLAAVMLGVVIGVARLSSIWVVSTVAKWYVEVLRNTPLLLQLLFWYSVMLALPTVHDAIHPLPGVFLSDRGLFLPSIGWHGGVPSLDMPQLMRFSFRGGLWITPEFATLLVGLATYTAAFIAEIVRSGVLAVDKGQTEAASALGLSRYRTLRLVVLPQALRVIIPPTTSQLLNLFKNSSLAVAIGYPELMSITTTTLNQTGQAMEAILIAMTCYLAISLSISLGMNSYNRRVVLRGQGA